MKNQLLWLVAFVMLSTVESYSQIVNLQLNWLWCDKTTENGQDEVYLITNHKYNGGNSGQSVSSVYNINDGNQPRQIGNMILWQGYLPAGSSVDITIFIMEQDGGGSQQIINQAQEIMKYAAPAACGAFPPSCPYAIAAYGIVKFAASLPSILQNMIPDTDDYIGSYTVRISNVNNMLYMTGYNPDRSIQLQGYALPNLNTNTGVTGVFVGDGSSYKIDTVAYFPR